MERSRFKVWHEKMRRYKIAVLYCIGRLPDVDAASVPDWDCRLLKCCCACTFQTNRVNTKSRANSQHSDLNYMSPGIMYEVVPLAQRMMFRCFQEIS